MENNDEIERLEGEILELKDKLKRVTDRELIYKDILKEISDSIDNQLKRDDENERLDLRIRLTSSYLFNI